VPSTRSVAMSLARRFNAGIHVVSKSRRVATIEFALNFTRRYATLILHGPFPALKGRAKLIPALRAEEYLFRASLSL
jgi:hypothetical protein